MNGDDELIAVVAENRYAAEMGKRVLKAEWNMPKVWQQSDIDALTTVVAERFTPVMCPYRVRFFLPVILALLELKGQYRPAKNIFRRCLH